MSPLHGYRVRAEPDELEGAANAGSTWSYGPCLHLGPRGQRCTRPALEGGFCARHSPEAIRKEIWIWSRRLAAILVTAALLWPIIASFLEELSHWRH
jgi:hypothetical protein